MTTEPLLNIKITANSLNFVLGKLGELPTHTGAWPLLQDLLKQGQEQLLAVTEPLAQTENTASNLPGVSVTQL